MHAKSSGPDSPAFERQVTGIQEGSTRFPRYDAAALGFEGYWYPVMWSRKLRSKPVALRLFGRDVMFLRERGKAYALENRCPHRGVPLSLGRREFAGTWTCPYHGWTFDVTSGVLVAALTDGPDSPICGKASVRTYAVEERFGLVWLFNGTGDPPPLETHVPQEFFHPDATLVGRITDRPGDWRYAAENGFDEGHAKYLHRNAVMMFFLLMPGFSRVKVEADDEAPWVTRKVQEVGFESEYPGLGTWPRRAFWQRKRRGARVSIRMPGLLRVAYPEIIHFEWYVPTAAGKHRYLQFLLRRRGGLHALQFKLWYWLWFRWLFHVQFNNQDASVVELMKTPPERLYRPDMSLIAWRHLCERESAGGATAMEPPEVLYAQQESEQSVLLNGP